MEPFTPDFHLPEALEEAGPFRILSCFQCRKCTVGCPLTFAMDLYPDEVVRLAVLGQKDLLLGCRTIWVCSSCETCTTRCPNRVRIAELMDRLKELAIAHGVPCPEEEVLSLHRAFLNQIQKRGRIFETTLLPSFYLKSGLWRKTLKEGSWLRELSLGAKMAGKGRLSWRPAKVKDPAEIEKLFQKKEDLLGSVKKGGGR